MSSPSGGGATGEALREEAATWFATMRGPDADRMQLDFERWRAGDPARREAYARIQQKFELTAALRHTETGRNRTLPNARSNALPSLRARYAFAVAAALLLVIAASLAVLGSPFTRTPVAALAVPLSTQIGQIRRQRLSDGSLVTLDTDSQVEIDFTSNARVVRLVRGRARFDVAHETRRPFIVEAAGRTVTAKGTIFDVYSYGTGFGVSLLRGKIDVVKGKALQPVEGTITHLAAGQALRSVGDKALLDVKPVGRGETAWVSGMLSFDGISLAEVLHQTNRYSKSKIQLADPSLGILKVTGAFRPLPISDLAAGLAAALSLHAEQSPGGDIILQRR